MSDPVMVAAEVTPVLVKAVQVLGDKVWDEACDAVVEEAVGFGRRLLAGLLRRGDAPATGLVGDAGSGVVGVAGTGGRAGVARAGRDLVTSPGDEDLQMGLRQQVGLRLAVRRLLAADPVLMAEVAGMVDRQAPAQRDRRVLVQRGGDGPVVFGGVQHGGVSVVGDGNIISFGGSAWAWR